MEKGAPHGEFLGWKIHVLLAQLVQTVIFELKLLLLLLLLLKRGAVERCVDGCRG